MLTFKLSNESTLTITLDLIGPSALNLTQTRTSDGTAMARITVPLSDVKAIVTKVREMLKFFT